MTTIKTVDAEIKPLKTTQRVREAESRIRNCLANGPLRAQSKEKFFLPVFCDVLTHVSCRGYVCILREAHVFTARLSVNQGGTADKLVFIRP